MSQLDDEMSEMHCIFCGTCIGQLDDDSRALFICNRCRKKLIIARRGEEYSLRVTILQKTRPAVIPR